MDLDTIRDAVEAWDNLQGEIDDFESEQQDLDTLADDYVEQDNYLAEQIDSKEKEQESVNDNLKAMDAIDIDDGREWMEAADASHYDDEVFEAAYNCDVSPNSVEEAYRGSYPSNADFAQDMAEQLGQVDRALAWPYTCIDWDWASRDLMMDYCECDCHYFMNL